VLNDNPHIEKPPLPSMPAGVVVRETICKTLLTVSRLGDYSMNCYVGCQHACAYCYARFIQRFKPHEEPWGTFVDVKINAVEALERQLRRAKPGAVFVSSACDGWQPLEERFCLTRECCRLLIEKGFTVHALTKGALILRDLDVLARGPSRVAVTLTCLDESLRKIWEPQATPIQQRIEVLRAARLAGIETGVMLGPLLPFLTDSQDYVDRLLERVAEEDVDVIWVDALNPRPKVWESLVVVLRRHYPELLSRYRAVLFSPLVREAYCQALHERVKRAAERLGIADRVVACMKQ